MRRGSGNDNQHARFRDISQFLPERSLIVLNDTRVMAARLHARKPTGGLVELLLTRNISASAGAPGSDQSSFDEIWECLGRSLGNAPVGSRLEVEVPTGTAPVAATIVERGDEGRFVVRLTGTGAGRLLEILDAIGEVPLPPYIEAARREAGCEPGVDDRDRYQTVYASVPGAVAAPTAGLHFTAESLGQLRELGHELCTVTLHVGPGTFRPVKTDDARAHRMDEEHYVVPEATAEAIARAQREGRAVIAVGTTVVRTLEASARANGGVVRAGAGATDLYILPGDPFAVVTGLITNFHLPKSTLLMLVCAFAGKDPVLATYAEAVARGYRFYSYGDAMFIQPQPAAERAP
jgi:S-adenosylmethionine:tRNA ribosyltransferase-isomerase